LEERRIKQELSSKLSKIKREMETRLSFAQVKAKYE